MVLMRLRVVSLKRHTTGALAVSFRVLSQKNMTGDKVICKNWYPLGEKKNLSHADKTGSWFLFGVLFKISDKHLVFFIKESLPPRGIYPGFIA